MTGFGFAGGAQLRESPVFLLVGFEGVSVVCCPNGACRAGRAGEKISPCAVQRRALGSGLCLVEGERQRCGKGKKQQLWWSLLFKGDACCFPQCLSASWGVSVVSVATARFSLLKAELFSLLFAGSGNSSLSSVVTVDPVFLASDVSVPV